MALSQDHPRMCGKYTKNESYPLPSHRITPACAGNTWQKKNIGVLFQDHPRMCGKYVVVIVSNGIVSGSPPHVREIPYEGVAIWTQPQDHPRMCGKYTKRSLYDATCNLRIPFFHSLLNFQFIS